MESEKFAHTSLWTSFANKATNTYHAKHVERHQPHMQRRAANRDARNVHRV